MKFTDRLALLAALALAVSLSGCANRKTQIAAERPHIVTKDYVEVQLTGSYIPVRVPKSPTARMAPTVSPLSILTPDEIARAVGPTFPMH